MKPKVGDTVSFNMNGKVVTGKVTYVSSYCGIDVTVGEDDYETIEESDIVPTPIPAEGS